MLQADSLALKHARMDPGDKKFEIWNACQKTKPPMDVTSVTSVPGKSKKSEKVLQRSPRQHPITDARIFFQRTNRNNQDAVRT